MNPSFPKLDGTSVSVLPASVIWEKSYGGANDDRAFYGVTAGDGYLVVGSTKSIVLNAILGWALRLDEDGKAIWNRTFLEGSGTEIRFAINLTDGFLLVGNEFLPSGDINGYVAKIDKQGTLIWKNVIGDEEVGKLFSAIAIQDGYLLLGTNYSNGTAHSDVWAVKIDQKGNVVWNKTYGNAEHAAARTGVLAIDGDYVLAGYAKPQWKSNYDFLLLKIDQNGHLIWNKTYGGTQSQKAYSMAESADGYVIIGDIESPQTDTDAIAVKVDFDGNVLWSEMVGGKNADSSSFITPLKSGEYLVAGFTFSFGAGNRDFWLFKIANSGQVVSSCTQGDAGFQEAYCVIETGESQYVIIGWTDPLGQTALIGKATYDFYTVKVAIP
jgi:hypothetical protein